MDWLDKIQLPLLQALSDGEPHSQDECVRFVARVCTEQELRGLTDSAWVEEMAARGLLRRLDGGMLQISGEGKREYAECRRLYDEMSEWMEVSLNALGEN